MKQKTERNNPDSSAAASSNSSSGVKKRAYSCYFEIRLGEEDFGKSRKEHYEVCNRALLTQLHTLSAEGRELCAHVTNETLIQKISSEPKQSPHETLVWEHCSTSTARKDEGVMRLVPKKQHTAGSEFWRILHPDYKNRGGYHEWAIPRGAPAELPYWYPKGLHERHIPNLSVEELPAYFHRAVMSNNLKEFNKLLARAQELSLSKHELERIITQTYDIRGNGKTETLLHVVVQHGYPQFIKKIMGYFKSQPGAIHQLNSSGESLAHIAAKDGRVKVVEELRRAGLDLTIKNRSGKTALDILAIQKKYQKANLFSIPEHSEPQSEDVEQEIEALRLRAASRSAAHARDPDMLYGDRPRAQGAQAQAAPSPAFVRSSGGSSATATARAPASSRISPAAAAAAASLEPSSKDRLWELMVSSRTLTPAQRVVQVAKFHKIRHELRNIQRKKDGLPPILNAEEQAAHDATLEKNKMAFRKMLKERGISIVKLARSAYPQQAPGPVRGSLIAAQASSGDVANKSAKKTGMSHLLEIMYRHWPLPKLKPSQSAAPKERLIADRGGMPVLATSSAIKQIMIQRMQKQTLQIQAAQPAQAPKANAAQPQRAAQAPKANTVQPQRAAQAPQANTAQPQRAAQAPQANTVQAQRAAQAPQANTVQAQRPAQAAQASTVQAQRPAQAAQASTVQPQRPVQAPQASAAQLQQPAKQVNTAQLQQKNAQQLQQRAMQQQLQQRTMQQQQQQRSVQQQQQQRIAQQQQQQRIAQQQQQQRIAQQQQQQRIAQQQAAAAQRAAAAAAQRAAAAAAQQAAQRAAAAAAQQAAQRASAAAAQQAAQRASAAAAQQAAQRAAAAAQQARSYRR